MIKSIIEKEWLEYRQDYRLRWMVGFIYLLFIAALITGIRHYTSVSETSKSAQKASYEQWLKQGKKNPHSAAHYGFYAYKPLSPMAIIDKGMESYLGQAVWLEAHNQNEVKEREATDGGSIVRFGNLSISFIFIFLMPLAIILQGFNLYCKEREWGTLPLLLSAATSVAQLFRGKALALYRLILLIFLPMLMISVISVLFSAGAGNSLQVLPSLMLLGIFLLLYYAVWVLLSLYISSLARHSSVALVALLAFWVSGTFLLPRMGSILSKSIFPTPSSFAFSNNVRKDNELGIDRKTTAAQRQKLFEDSLVRTYKVEKLSELPLNIRGLNLKRSEEYGYLVFEKNYGGLEKIYQTQDQVMNWLNFLSPAQSMRSISAGYSGTDFNKQLHFASLAEDHRRLIATVMNDDIAENSIGVETYEVDEQLWAKIPPFEYKEASLGNITRPQLFPIFSLAFWLCGLFYLLKKRAATITGL